MRGYTPHPPDPAIWADVPYPPPPLAPPELRIDVVRAIVDGARARGLAVEIQVSPYTLPGRARRPDVRQRPRHRRGS